MEFTHKPVLLAECIEALHIRPEGIYVDGTLGRAGHSREIAKRLTTGRLICVDRDQAAIDAAQERLAPWMAVSYTHLSPQTAQPEPLPLCGPAHPLHIRWQPGTAGGNDPPHPQ